MADLMKALSEAHQTAQDAVSALEAKLQAASPDELADLTDQYNGALTLEEDANDRMVGEILNPGGNDTIAKLETATGKLKERIAKFEAEAESLSQLAGALNILASVVKLVLLV